MQNTKDKQQTLLHKTAFANLFPIVQTYFSTKFGAHTVQPVVVCRDSQFTQMLVGWLKLELQILIIVMIIAAPINQTEFLEQDFLDHLG